MCVGTFKSVIIIIHLVTLTPSDFWYHLSIKIIRDLPTRTWASVRLYCCVDASVKQENKTHAQLFNILFCQQVNTWCIVYAGTKFPIYKVRWLWEASQIGQTFVPLCGESRLKHSTAEFQSIQHVLAASGHRQKKFKNSKYWRAWRPKNGDFYFVLLWIQVSFKMKVQHIIICKTASTGMLTFIWIKIIHNKRLTC